MMRQFGNVIGMTGYPEVVLAKEAELCYASLCIVTNLACGLVEGKALHASEIMDLMHELDNSLRQVIKGTLKKIPAQRMCRCKDALKNALL